MKAIKLFITLCIIYLSFGLAAQETPPMNTITYEGKEYFLNGYNVAWNKFGGDVGMHYMWGALYDSLWFEDLFAKSEKNGINCVRLWIHTDGRANPEFDKEGYVTGLDPGFFYDLDDIFRRAKNHNIFVMPCLWSFDMLKDFREGAGRFAGWHHDLVMDEKKAQSYIDNALIPMVKRYKDQCNLIAWEVCNEPEWGLTRARDSLNLRFNYSTGKTVPIKDFQRFTGMIAAAVHEHSDKMVTTGSAMLLWNSDEYLATGNLWSDEALQAAYDDPKAYLDFYQIHYYDYMASACYDPFDLEIPTTKWGFDKPVIIGECPSSPQKSHLYTNDEMIENAYANGYAGILFWSANGHDGFGGFDDFKAANKKFAKDHPKLVSPGPFPCSVLDDEQLGLAVEEQGNAYVFSWNAVAPDNLSYYIIQKSNDGENFSNAKRVKKNKKGGAEYQYRLKMKNESPTSFRLKKVDKDGYESFSAPIQAK